MAVAEVAVSVGSTVVTCLRLVYNRNTPSHFMLRKLALYACAGLKLATRSAKQN